MILQGYRGEEEEARRREEQGGEGERRGKERDK